MKCTECGYLNKGSGNCTMCDNVMSIPEVKLKIKEENVKSLVEELDRVFSIFIRTRNMNADGLVKCFTCGDFKHWRKGDCGHYVSRDNKPLRWHEINCQFQCKHCNITLKGNYPAFAHALTRVYGKQILDQLEIIKHNTMKLDRGKLKILIQLYSKRIAHVKI